MMYPLYFMLSLTINGAMAEVFQSHVVYTESRVASFEVLWRFGIDKPAVETA
jgi:hypothetical protein